MNRTACIAAAGLLLVNSALPALAQSCSISTSGTAYAFTALPDPKTNKFSLNFGYRLNVNVPGGQKIPVLLDTGSNVLVIPAAKIKGFPANPDKDTSGFVISKKLPYGYGSSGNSYQGYMVNVPVTVSDAKGVSMQAGPVQVYAVTEFCKPTPKPANGGTAAAPTAEAAKTCTPVGASSQIAMMGIGFQSTNYLKVFGPNGTTVPATKTNVFEQVSNIATQGWIFGPGTVVVGLNTAVTKPFKAWSQMQDGGQGNLVADGCVQVTPNGKAALPAQCGTMLLDTGMTAMNMWVNEATQKATPICAAPPSNAKAGFDGAPFPAKTAVTITSPATNPILTDNFTIGTKSAGQPDGTFCSTTSSASHFNSARMPLALYSFARNQSCGTFSYVKN